MNRTEGTTLAEGISMLRRAEWAAASFGTFDHARVAKIVTAVADAAHREADRFAQAAVRETGFGVAEHKAVKNRAMSREFAALYAEHDYSSHRVNSAAKMIEIPRPAGVILALTPSTSPVAGLYFKVLCALMTRSAIVISPHPAAADTCMEAGRILAEVATAAGAPDGAIQVLDRPSVTVVQQLMAQDRTKLVLATGGAAMVKAAYQSGTPALGVGPGNPPVVVDETADLRQAAQDLVTSKDFDHSVLCTAESVLMLVESVEREFLSHLTAAGAHICSDAETVVVRDFMYPDGAFNSQVVGLSAPEIAMKAGFRVPDHTKVLVTPINAVLDEESLTHEKLSPVLALRTVPTFQRALAESQALLRIVGRGHSAVIHSRNPQHVLDFGRALSSHRITVNAPGSTGSAGLGTHLAPTMSVGTGFAGGSAAGENLRPDHLVQWTRIAYGSAPEVEFPDFTGAVARPPAGLTGDRVPPIPRPTNEPRLAGTERSARTAVQKHPDDNEVFEMSRDDLRRILAEELSNLIGGR